MKGTSKVIMGATLVMVISLAVVLGLILVLLAELYCSLLLRRRHLRNSTNNTAIPTAAAATPQTTTIATASSSYYPSQHFPPPPFNNKVYAQGVLQAPRSFLFPSVSCMEEQNANASPRRIGLVSVPSPLASFISRAPPPKHVQEDPLQGSASETLCCHDHESCCSAGEHHLVYISNPIYENEEGKVSAETILNTPFETPDTSPSRLERSISGGSSGDDDDDDNVVVVGAAVASSPCTPHLTPMKKLPAEACSVSLRDARSLGTSASDSRSNNCLSSSSSGSPCTSPSW